MFKEGRVMFIYTETSLHAGSGISLGVIDLPIQREKYTDYPVLQASGIKGAVRDWFETNKSNDRVKMVFGPDTIGGEGEAFTGAATFTDARLLLFPVRSLKGVFAYTTSCFALNRLKRDLAMAKVKVEWNVPAEPQNNQLLGIQDSSLIEDGKVVLEEYTFDFKPDNDVKKIADWLSTNAFPNGDEYQFWREKVKKDLVILPEDAFKDFVKLSTEVQARIRIINETKTVAPGALFSEEALTPDTLLYSVVMANDPFKDNRPTDLQDANAAIDFICQLNGNRTQFGGDTTIGKGIVNIKFLDGGKK